MEIENLGGITECIVYLFFRPDVECAFGSLHMPAISARGYRAVGFLRGKKAAVFRRHGGSDVIKDVARDHFVLLVFWDLERIEIREGELRLVEKLFFEVRHLPVTINRITMKPTPDVIVHPACSHLAQRKQR